MKNKFFGMLMTVTMLLTFNSAAFAACPCRQSAAPCPCEQKSVPCPVAKRTFHATGSAKCPTYKARKVTKGCPKCGCPAKTTTSTPCPCGCPSVPCPCGQ